MGSIKHLALLMLSLSFWFSSQATGAPEHKRALATSKLEALVSSSDLIIIGKFKPLSTERMARMPVAVSAALKGSPSTNTIVACFIESELTLGSERKNEWIMFLAAPFQASNGREYRNLADSIYDYEGLVLKTSENIERIKAILKSQSVSAKGSSREGAK